MIGKGKSISHTKASMQYGWNNEKEAEIVYRNNLIGHTPEELSKEFRYIQRLNDNCYRNTISFVLSPTIADKTKLDNKMLHAICKEFSRKMELGDRQAIGFLHRDKHHTHIHLYSNRIDFDGSAYDDSFIGKKSQRMAAETASKLGLETVQSVLEKNKLRTKVERQLIYNHHLQILKVKPKSITDYVELMRQNKIDVQPVINAANKLQGFTFNYSNKKFKGSEVHRNMSGKNVLKDLLQHSIAFRKTLRDKKIKINDQYYDLHGSLAKIPNETKEKNITLKR
ncbi:relaxase/mobilization nuclease domain-containing protein [Zunongwangia sp.]|uniref:relaxase/mobilization nuclease domain-containing protein n=1 Tax=Zunongwangia sp. TaxID=1965325 RepID=UPI003AA8095C